MYTSNEESKNDYPKNDNTNDVQLDECSDLQIYHTTKIKLIYKNF